MVNFIKKQNIYGPVEKLQFLSDAAAISELSRAELAVLNVLADMANATTGLAWPSFQTLGKRIGTTDRSAKRAVSGLAKAGLLEIVEHGTRNHKSNRYKLGKIQTSDTDVTTAASDTHVTTPSDTDDTTLVTRVTGASDTHVTQIYSFNPSNKRGWNDRSGCGCAPAPWGAWGWPPDGGK